MTLSYEPPSAASIAGAELPIHLTRFVGRERELRDLSRLVGTTRLLTLTGAGGSGKTRLARETAIAAAATFARVVWVDLAALGDPTLLVQHVAAALHLPERSGDAGLEAIATGVCDELLLLVLDNCEHLVDACAVLADALLRACPRLTILATSREALGVASETAWLVPPLASAEAVQLFVDRAQAALPTFAQTPANAPALAEICRRLDGIPLAIELAAARARVLPPEQIARRLGDAFRLLTAGGRTALPRHRTLRATMEWSYALLGTREQSLLRRLAAFSGGFTLEAAEAVCAGEPLDAEDILDGVSALVDKSLVLMDAGDGAARYRLLETVRQYGLERLAEAGESDAVTAAHAAYYLSVVEAVAPRLVGGAMEPALIAALTTEHDNLRAASFWAAADPAHNETALRFVSALFWYWYSVGLFGEARELADRAFAVSAPVDPLVRGRALVAGGLTKIAQGDYARACRDFEDSLPVLRAHADDMFVGVALAKLGAARLLLGDTAVAIATLDEGIAFAATVAPDDMGGVFARFWRAWAAYRQGDYELAKRTTEDNLAKARRYGHRVTFGHSLATLARIEMGRGDLEAACTLAMESLEIELALGDGWGIGLALDVVGVAAARRGHLEDATRLIAGIEAHRARLSVALPGVDPEARVAIVDDLRERLGERFDQLYAEGRMLSTAEAASLAVAVASRHTTEHRVVFAEPAAAPPALAAERSRLRVLALGPLQVFVGGQLVESTAWGSARPRELLIYLLMHPDGRTKEHVGLAFWPDASAAQLRNSFHVTLHRLRKALGSADAVALANDRYRVDPELLDEFDVALFEEELQQARRAMKRQHEGATALLEAALARFRGDLLDGEPVGDWHLEHRDRLQRLYVDALMELGSRHAKEERPAKAAEAYRRVLARDELHEDALAALMRALADQGERSQALRAYRRFADRLRAELEAEPDDETTALFERLQQGAAV